jgi:hypothetical protein
MYILNYIVAILALHGLRLENLNTSNILHSTDVTQIHEFRLQYCDSNNIVENRMTSHSLKILLRFAGLENKFLF